MKDMHKDEIKRKLTYKKSRPFSAKLFAPMVMLSVLQLCCFIAVLIFGGEFSYIKQYGYNTLTEKTANRKNYVENMLTQKTAKVIETERDITGKVTDILNEENLTIEDIKTNKELNKKILSESAESLIYLLRTNQVNDAYIILDTGNLYNSDGNERAAGLYFRDLDLSDNRMLDNKDLFMEMGLSEVAKNSGISLDYEWSPNLKLNEMNKENFDFYYTTMANARNSQHPNVYNLGYWTGYSKISPSAQPSMKYTVPLISEDGNVYGIIGIGLMEKTVISAIPANDFIKDGACYMLSKSNGDDVFSTVSRSGSFYTKLDHKALKYDKSNELSSGIYSFGESKGSQIIGSIQSLNLYKSGSPYIREQWAVISAADEDIILTIYNGLFKMIIISSAIALVLNLLCAAIINKKMTDPVKRMTHKLADFKSEGDIITFDFSNIDEIDTLAKAITELQINIKENSSRVSKIISMADVGIGVFMCDLSNQSVFVGESVFKLLSLDSGVEEDVTITLNEFKYYIKKFDQENKVFSSGIFEDNFIGDNSSTNIEIVYYSPEDKRKHWFKFSLTRDNETVIGLIQDTTNLVIEKKKIEYERDYDLTTGLFNRRAFYNRIDELFSHPELLKTAAFIMWDLDNLKYVNDTYGHDFGDDYIKTAANVFKTFRGYGGIVSRLSGDEFIIFLYGFETKDDIRSAIKQVREQLNNSCCILSDGSEYKIRASGGISWYPDDSDSYEMLVKYADFAMYTIKHKTKGSIAEFDFSVYSKDSILVVGVEEMNRIIDEEAIKYAFQGIVSVKTGEIYGYEALMRPQSNILKSAPEFIRIARTGAKLYEIERLTWLHAMTAFRQQCEKGNISKDAKIFINTLLNTMIKDSDLNIVEKENKDYLDRIVIEFLESDKAEGKYLKNKQETAQKWGAMTALDDFGSGYNSEYALINYEPDIIKIDRSIIGGCDRDISRTNIINNLVQLAATKNILVLAEGVETYSEMQTVISCGVDLIQGYYISRPMFEAQPLSRKIKKEIADCQMPIDS